MERQRLLFIDNLRILLISLVVMVHLAVTYGGVGSWYYKEGQADTLTFVVLTFHNATVQSFFMGFLFMIAGYFTAAAYDRKGPWPFLKGRLLRLGIPLLCYDFVISPLLAYPLLRAGAIEFDGSYRELLAKYYGSFHIGTGPLWFVETLLIFSAAYILWRRVTRATTTGQRDGQMPSNLRIAVLAVALGLATFVVRIWFPIGWGFEPLNLQFPFFVQYVCAFPIGIIAYRRNWFVRVPAATGRLWFTVAAVFAGVLFPALFVFGGALSGQTSRFIGGLHWQCFAYALWEQFIGLAMMIALLVIFRKRLDRQGRVAKLASASAYTAYIIHPPVVVLLTLAARDIRLYPLLKFALAALVIVPLCFALGNAIRNLPLARRIL